MKTIKVLITMGLRKLNSCYINDSVKFKLCIFFLIADNREEIFLLVKSEGVSISARLLGSRRVVKFTAHFSESVAKCKKRYMDNLKCHCKFSNTTISSIQDLSSFFFLVSSAVSRLY